MLSVGDAGENVTIWGSMAARKKWHFVKAAS